VKHDAALVGPVWYAGNPDQGLRSGRAAKRRLGVVGFHVFLCRFRCEMQSVQMMPMREVRMMRGSLMIACLVVFCCFPVMTSRVLVVFRGPLVMFCGAR